MYDRSKISKFYGFIMKKILFLCCLTLLSSRVQADLELNITSGHLAPIPIAITDIGTESSSTAELAARMTEVIKNDLTTSGLFRLIPKSGFLQKQETLNQGVHFSEWRLINADNLFTARIIESAWNTLKVEFRLFDTIRELQIEGQAFTGSDKDWRRIAHKIADAIYKRLTGDQGYFDTEIVYISRTEKGNKRTERLAVMDYDGANHHFLTQGDTLVLTPRFSPDRRYITYLDYATRRQPRVYIFDRQTKTKTLVGNFPGMTFAPRFSPDGSRLIMSFAQKGNTSLFEMDFKSLKIRRLTFDPVIDTSPCYSPDGTKIVFNSDRSGQTHLYVMDAQGGSAERISFGSGSYRTPVWSPRGDWIAYTKIFQGEFYIGVIRPDGSGERLITKGYLVEGPAWSSNGHSILFTRDDRQGRPRLNVIDFTGYNEREIPTPNQALQGDWSTLR
jgi:tol-pal system beta propeller repeat protein TolB